MKSPPAFQVPGRRARSSLRPSSAVCMPSSFESQSWLPPVLLSVRSWGSPRRLTPPLNNAHQTRKVRMQNMRGSERVRFVSFSGVDGAGKSTQIALLCAKLEERGVRIHVLRFWDDIARLTKLREGTGHHVFKGDKG